jgi:adenylosuccinate synthase
MKVDVILGLQWGDEGKGKIVDVLTPRYDITARFQGGPNAGHTIEFEGKKFVLHTIPSGIFHKSVTNVIGNGVIIDPFIFMKEVDNLTSAGHTVIDNLIISRRAHLILPSHRLLDAVYETAKGAAKIGSTLKGIGPTYTDKYARNGLRTGDIGTPEFMKKYREQRESHLGIAAHYGFDLTGFRIDNLPMEEYEQHWLEALDRLAGFTFDDTEYYLNRALDSGKSVLAEGAQGTLLDVDFGSYPFVTSSNTITAGVCSGLGIAPQRIGTVYGVFKAYCTRVGSGPFPTELHDAEGEMMRQRGHEFGSTTGRPRRCGWLDLPALEYSVMVNGVNRLIMMKADVLSPLEKIRICTAYKQEGALLERFPFALDTTSVEPVYTPVEGWSREITSVTEMSQVPEALVDYIAFIEKRLGVPVGMISVGPDRCQTLMRDDL